MAEYLVPERSCSQRGSFRRSELDFHLVASRLDFHEEVAPGSIDYTPRPVRLSLSSLMAQDALPQPVAEQMRCPDYHVTSCGSIY